MSHSVSNSQVPSSQAKVGFGIWWSCVSIRLDQPAYWSNLFGDKAGDSSTHSSSLADHLKKKLGAGGYILNGLLELEASAKLLTHTRLSPFVTRYAFDWEKASCLPLEFGKQDRASLLVYEDTRGRRLDNEFLIRLEENPSSSDLIMYQAQLQFAEVLSTRRSMLFSPNLALHTFSVLLPPGLLTELLSELNYFVFPIAHFLRLPHAPYFRRTSSLSLLLVPVDKTQDRRPRSIEAGAAGAVPELARIPELRRIADSGWEMASDSPEGGKYFLSGPLKGFLKAPNEPMSLRYWMEESLYSIVSRIVDRRNESRLRDAVFRAVRVSRYSGLVGVVDDITEDTLVRWAVNPERKMESSIEPWIANLLGEDFVKYHPPDTMLLKPSDIGYPTFIDARERISLWPFAPDRGDPDGDYSKLFSKLGWGLFDSVGLSALQEMLSVFHHQIEGSLDSATARAFMESFVGDVEEYFDFDFMPDYKAHFESLKNAVRINEDFARLREKLDTLEQQKIVEEQEYTNTVLVILAIVGTVATFLAILESLDKANFFRSWHSRINDLEMASAVLILVLLVSTISFYVWRRRPRWVRSTGRLIRRLFS